MKWFNSQHKKEKKMKNVKLTIEDREHLKAVIMSQWKERGSKSFKDVNVVEEVNSRGLTLQPINRMHVSNLRNRLGYTKYKHTKKWSRQSKNKNVGLKSSLDHNPDSHTMEKALEGLRRAVEHSNRAIEYVEITIKKDNLRRTSLATQLQKLI